MYHVYDSYTYSPEHPHLHLTIVMSSMSVVWWLPWVISSRGIKQYTALYAYFYTALSDEKLDFMTKLIKPEIKKEEKEDSLFGVAAFKANRQQRVSQEARRILTILPRYRTDKEIHYVSTCSFTWGVYYESLLLSPTFFSEFILSVLSMNLPNCTECLTVFTYKKVYPECTYTDTWFHSYWC